MRRISTVIAAAAVAAAAALSPIAATAAPAQNTGNYVQLVKVLNGEIATANCDVLGGALKATKMVDDTTTRSGLVANLNKAVGENSTLRLVTAPSINAVGDRALECGIVKADPVTPMDQLVKLSSKLSSESGLPELRNLTALSS